MLAVLGFAVHGAEDSTSSTLGQPEPTTSTTGFCLFQTRIEFVEPTSSIDFSPA